MGGPGEGEDEEAVPTGALFDLKDQAMHCSHSGKNTTTKNKWAVHGLRLGSGAGEGGARQVRLKEHFR